MLVKNLKKLGVIVAGDGTLIHEIFHPKNDPEIKNRYSLAHTTLKKRKSSKKHRMKNPEIYYFLQGKAEMYINDEVEMLGKGDSVYIPEGTIFYVKNIGNTDLEFLCITDPAWSEEEEEILE